MITLNKELANKIWKFLRSPITALVFSILLSVFFYYLSISYKSPSFYNSPPELIAKKSDSYLKIFYKSEELTNVYFTNLVIWNDGDNFIDYSDFVKSKPIKFYSNDSIKILSVSLDSKSRQDLKFESKIKNNKVIIRLLEDEALEEGDGASFHILYTKITNKNNFSFHLDSRIKGTTNGFIFKDVTNFKKGEYRKSIYFLWSVIILLLSIRILTLYFYKKTIVFRTVEFVFILTLIVITIYLTIQQIFFTTNLIWIK